MGRLSSLTVILIIGDGERPRRVHLPMTRSHRQRRRVASPRQCRRSGISKLDPGFSTAGISSWPQSISKLLKCTVISFSKTNRPRSMRISRNSPRSRPQPRLDWPQPTEQTRRRPRQARHRPRQARRRPRRRRRPRQARDDRGRPDDDRGRRAGSPGDHKGYSVRGPRPRWSWRRGHHSRRQAARRLAAARSQGTDGPGQF